MSLLPTFCAMMLMLSAFTSSGTAGLMAKLLSPLSGLIGLPQKATPLALLRPLTGSGSLAALNEVFADSGPDSRAGMVASVLMGSGETLFYTLSVYLGAAGIRKLPHVAWASLTAYIAGVVVCCLVVRG